MAQELLPFDEPVFYEGKYIFDEDYPLYIQMISCTFKIKKNKIPTIQIKKNPMFIENEYLEYSGVEPVTLVLTNVDLKLFLEHYNTYDLKYNCGWKFRGAKGLFTEYIEKWIKVKNEATLSGNKPLRSIAKLLLNSLYGKFATGLKVKSKIPYLGDDDIIHYKFAEETTKDGVYLPIGCFITSYARKKTISTSQAIKDYSLNKYGKDLYYYS